MSRNLVCLCYRLSLANIICSKATGHYNFAPLLPCYPVTFLRIDPRSRNQSAKLTIILQTSAKKQIIIEEGAIPFPSVPSPSRYFPADYIRPLKRSVLANCTILFPIVTSTSRYFPADYIRPLERSVLANCTALFPIVTSTSVTFLRITSAPKNVP